MQYEIKPMSAAHLPRLAQLEQTCFSAPWTQQALAEELSNGQAHFLVAQSDGEVLGYLGVQEIAGEGYITNVAAGCGLIRCAGNIVPFENSFPKNTELYRLMTTKPGEGGF